MPGSSQILQNFAWATNVSFSSMINKVKMQEKIQKD